MPSESPSNSPVPGLDDPEHHSSSSSSSSSPMLVEHLAAGLKLASQEHQQLQRDQIRSSPHSSHAVNSITDDLEEADADEEDTEQTYPVKRPRTPSSVPPMPVSRKLNVSTKIVKSTESLHVADIVTFGSQDRSPLRSKYSTTTNNNGDQSQQFCLKWNSYQTNLSKEFDDLLQNESFVDVTLACDGHSVKAHKMVLSACSPYFQALFFDNPCQHPIIIMKEVKWPELKAVVEYMYRGEINVGRDQIEPLLRVANMLKIRGLTDVDQYLNAPSPDENDAAAKVSRKSPKIDTPGGKEMTPDDTEERYAKKVQDKIRELVDINENVEKVFQHQQQHRDTSSADGNRVSPSNSSSKLSDSESKCVNLVRGSGGGGISVRDREHLLQPDSPIALTAAVAAAQDRLNRANQATRKRRWMTGSVEGGMASPLAENHHHQLTNRSSSSPDTADNLRASPSSASLLAMQNSSALQMIHHQQQQQHQQQGHHHPSVSVSSAGGNNNNNGSNSGTGAGNSASSSASSGPNLPFSIPQSTLESMGLSSLGLPAPATSDDMEIKPGIAEMIREEERVSHETSSPNHLN